MIVMPDRIFLCAIRKEIWKALLFNLAHLEIISDLDSGTG